MESRTNQISNGPPWGLAPGRGSAPRRSWAPRPLASSLLAGALAGMIAAVPMALVMAGLNKAIPAGKGPRSWLSKIAPLPPKQIKNRLAKRSGLFGLVRPQRKWGPTTWLAHLGYGAAAASLYPVVTRPLPVPDVLRGMLFALGVWGVSYLGWLPAVNILPPATQQPARRNVVLIASHLVWGSLIGLLANRIIQQTDRIA